MLSAILYPPPRLWPRPPAFSLPHVPPGQGCPFRLCISYSIVCSNNFNGSRERISFARRLERNLKRIQEGIAGLFLAGFDAFLLFHSFRNLLCFIVYFTNNFVLWTFFWSPFVALLVFVVTLFDTLNCQLLRGIETRIINRLYFQ